MTGRLDRVLHTRPRQPSVGVVISVGSDSSAMVLVGGAEVPAFITDQVFDRFYTIGGGITGIGAVVTVLPVGDTYEIIATRTGTTGGGGLILGPELLPNNGFEYGSVGAEPDHWSSFWTNGPAVTTWDTTAGQALSGTGRALVTLTPTTDPVDTRVGSEPVVVDPGTIYLAAAWVKATSSGSSLVTKLDLYTAPNAIDTQPFGTGLVVQTAVTVSAPGAAYQYASGPVTVPAGHNYARLYLVTTAVAGANLAVSWDEASLRQRITS